MLKINVARFALALGPLAACAEPASDPVEGAPEVVQTVESQLAATCASVGGQCLNPKSCTIKFGGSCGPGSECGSATCCCTF